MVRDLLDRLSEQAGAEVLLLCVGLSQEDRTSLLADLAPWADTLGAP